jgi:steroid 5-alpha reductase family enzyme
MLEAMIELSFIGLTVMAGLMFLVWLIHIPLKNAGIVDVAWAFGLALLAAVYAILGDGDILRKWIFASMVIAWGLRLTAHLFVRVTEHDEDGRYAQMRKERGGNIPLKFLAFFQFQALLNVFLAIPFLLVSVNTNSGLSYFEIAGMIIWAIALIGESVADHQLRIFKKDSSNKGRTCRNGLWNYSRHPNYFSEWLIWVSFFVFALGSPYGWITVLCPALMLYFLFRVTGIPATEAQALRTKGDDYREYQRTTSAFVPWFKKS